MRGSRGGRACSCRDNGTFCCSCQLGNLQEASWHELCLYIVPFRVQVVSPSLFQAIEDVSSPPHPCSNPNTAPTPFCASGREVGFCFNKAYSDSVLVSPPDLLIPYTSRDSCTDMPLGMPVPGAPA